MKNILIVASTVLFSFLALAQNNLRQAGVQLNRTLNPGEALSVRKLLNDLHPGDFVVSLQVRAASNQPGSYLQLIINDKLVRNLSVSQSLQVINTSIMKRNGVDYSKLVLRTVGPIYIEFLSVTIDDQAYQPNPNPYDPNPYPQPQPQPDPYYPPSPQPQPDPYYPPSPYPGSGSLSGYCDDYDHAQFYAAKQFAYSTTGLNLGSNEATQWALDYNRSHACNTINEFQSRFSVAYNFAYSTTGLNMSAVEARDYALSKVEHMTAEQIRAMTSSMSEMKQFAYSTTGLNLSSSEASWLARYWGERGYCEVGSAFSNMRNQYQRDYNFAYSTTGLNMSSSEARRYAVDRLSSRCIDLIRQVVN